MMVHPDILTAEGGTSKAVLPIVLNSQNHPVAFAQNLIAYLL